MKIYKGDIPFTKDGKTQLTCVSYWDKLAVMRPNAAFKDTITYSGFGRGRSAAHFYFTTSDGTAVTVFMTSLGEMMPHLHAGKVTGTFAYEKRGMNYGLKRIGD